MHRSLLLSVCVLTFTWTSACDSGDSSDSAGLDGPLSDVVGGGADVMGPEIG